MYLKAVIFMKINLYENTLADITVIKQNLKLCKKSRILQKLKILHNN